MPATGRFRPWVTTRARKGQSAKRLRDAQPDGTLNQSDFVALDHLAQRFNVCYGAVPAVGESSRESE